MSPRGAWASPAGTPAEAVAWLAERPSATGLFTDFDGTLSPVVAHPEDAEALPGVVESLGHLAARLAVVGVVSGRPAGFLVRRIRAEGVHLYGLHGVELATGSVTGDGAVEVLPGAVAWREALAAASSTARAQAPDGVEVEDKRFGLTLHWRNAADRARAATGAVALAEELAGPAGLLVRAGKASVELVPPIGVDKGSVVAEWANRVERVSFLGDDVSDLLAFGALEEVRARGRTSTLKIAVTSPEAPPELLERADLVLSGPEEAARLLARLAERLD